MFRTQNHQFLFRRETNRRNIGVYSLKSLERMLGILDLFEGATPEWTVERLHQELGYTRSTLYRYLKVLTDAGFLAALPDIGYTLGPRIIELDYKIRTRDRLILASKPAMAELVGEIPSIALLCRCYKDKVLCIHQERSKIGRAHV